MKRRSFFKYIFGGFLGLGLISFVKPVVAKARSVQAGDMEVVMSIKGGVRDVEKGVRFSVNELNRDKLYSSMAEVLVWSAMGATYHSDRYRVKSLIPSNCLICKASQESKDRHKCAEEHPELCTARESINSAISGIKYILEGRT
ncbi:hypothetical protein LCGC14_1149850 [marine sediment metagenome]|uniref:Uncharacterized protein n=1 Tax=marine sediment metagenome TaxID=412755 RepID=A0A0F9MJ18_9ZZZZ